MTKLKLFKVLFFAGIALMGTAVFVDSFKVALLSDAKSSEKRLKQELKEAYDVEAPDRPLNEADYTLAPEKPGDEASEAEKAAYEKALKEHEGKTEALKKKYESDLEKYKADYREYQRKQKEMNFRQTLDSRVNKDRAEEIDKSIESYQLCVNEFIFSSILRFFGMLVFLTGSLGVLVLGDNYERLGVLAVIGFGFKTILGL